MEPPRFQDQALVMLSVTHETNDQEFPRRSIVLSTDQASINIGRQSQRRQGLESNANNFLFDCPVMSRNHATIRLDSIKQEVLLKDTKSLHGTFVNSIRLDPAETRRLYTGDIITFGVNIDRGTEKFHPYEVEATIAFGSDRRQDQPMVFRVPDESDVEDLSSSEGESGTAYAQTVLRDNNIRPAPQLPPIASIDLTSCASCNDGPFQSASSISVPVVDLTSAEPDVYEEVSDYTPPKLSIENSQPNAFLNTNTNNTDGDGYMEWDNEEATSELDEEFSYGSEPSESYPSDIESPMTDGNNDYEYDGQGQSSFFSDEELSDGAELVDDTENFISNEDIEIPDTTTTILLTSMDSVPLMAIPTGEPGPHPSNALRSEGGEVADVIAPSNLVLQEERTQERFSSSQDKTVNFESSSSSDLLLQPCTNQASSILAQKTGKADFFSAREENKKKFNPEMNIEDGKAGKAGLNVPNELGLPPITVEKEMLSLPSMEANEGSQESWQQFSPLEVSGRDFLNTPLTSDELPASSDPGVIDDTSAYTFEISKKGDIVEISNVKQSEQAIGEKTQESPNPRKRKAAEISELAMKELTDDFRSAMKAEEAAQSPKRLRRAAEVMGYVALGGIAVMSALIATAPAL